MTFEVRHAGLVARRAGGFWRGVLIEGRSGAGKSDLALRLLERGWRLVADDRVIVWVDAGRLYGRAPDALRDRIEVRGVGVEMTRSVKLAEIVLRLAPGAPERIPDMAAAPLLGVGVPRLVVEYLHGSAPLVVEQAFEAFDAARKRRI